MIFQYIGLGACGCRLVKTIEENLPPRELTNILNDSSTTAEDKKLAQKNIAKYLKDKKIEPPLYINFDSKDFKELTDIAKSRKLLLEGEGTGRSPGKGEEFAQRNKSQIKEFLVKKLNPDHINILFFGSGGGSGSGLAPVIIDVLSSGRSPYKLGVAMTFPENEDLVVNQNAIKTLNKIMERQDTLKPFIMIDNEYLSNSVKHDPSHWWGRINGYIANNFVSINQLFEDDSTETSSERGISNLDVAELKRLFHTPGLTDIRTIMIPEESLKREDFIDRFKTALTKESLSGRYNLKDTLGYGCVVVAGEKFQNMHKIQSIFDVVASETPNSAIRRVGTIFRESVQEEYSELNIKFVKIVLVCTGYKLPADINKKIKKIQTEGSKFVKTKAKESKVKLEGEALNDFVGDDFEI